MITKFSLSTSLSSVFGGVQLIREIQCVSDEGSSPLIQLLSHVGRRHGD